jgi:hypothetical protein
VRINDESAARLRFESASVEREVDAPARAAHGTESTAKLCATAMHGVVITAQTTKATLNTPDGRGIICAEEQTHDFEASMKRISGFLIVIAPLVTGASPMFAQAGGAQPTQRLQGTRNMHVACVGPDSGRTFQRAIGDSLNRATRLSATDSARVTGGTVRSRQYPEYDVVLDIPNLCVERIFLKVDSLTAKLNLDAAVSNLVRVTAGADVLIGNVDLTIQDVRARALLLIDLDNVVHIVDNTLTFIDNHPEIVQQLGSTLNNVGGAVGGLTGEVVGAVRGLVMSTTRLANGGSLQKVVDQATGQLLDRTLDTAGKVVGERVLGNVLNLATVKETAGPIANTVVRQVRDQAGNLIEFTLNNATKAISNLRIIK